MYGKAKRSVIKKEVLGELRASFLLVWNNGGRRKNSGFY
jgi:hypothetical protein